MCKALLLLKRVARYLVGHREITISYPYQSHPSQIDCYTDADRAGDVTTRLSTTTGALMHGAHWLEGWSVTQKVRALSSGESEFYAQGSGAVQRLVDETHRCPRSCAQDRENTCAPLRLCCEPWHGTTDGCCTISPQ